MSFALALLGVSAASAPLVSVGALGGVRLTDGFHSFNDESRIYDVGGSVEVRLPAGFAVEADALYQRIGYSYGLMSSAGAAPVGILAFRERGNLWEFPLLGKYYFRPRSESWQPFVGIGPAFRTASLHSQESASILSGANLSSAITTFRGTFDPMFRPGRQLRPAFASNWGRLRCCRRCATHTGATRTTELRKMK